MSRRRTILILGAALGAGALVARRMARRSRARDAGEPQGRRGPVHAASGTRRNLEVARLGSQTAANVAVHKARRAFASEDRRAELDTAFELRTAEQVAAALGNMKGALMKIGQKASYLDQGLPDHVREAFAQLQSDAPPMSAELAAECVETELGAPVERVFAEFEENPLAAASIGQVHRALLWDGREVAVKVQYPGVDKAITADLQNAGLLFGGLGMLFPGLDSGPLVEELRNRLVEELDYSLEARNQQLFADFWRGHPYVHIPDVVPELCSARVLTTELAGGVRFDEVLAWSQEERDLAGETIFRFVFRSLYRLGAFNGDPHPGNYLFRPGGQVTFLDFGLVKHFEPAELDVFGAMIQALVLEGDVGRFRQVVEEVGLLKEGMGFSNELVEGYFGHFYEFVMADEQRTMTPEYATESMRRIFDTSGPFGEIMKAANVPPSFVLIQRINMGLYAILGDLRATRNWRRIAEELWPFVSGAPSTPMGEAENAWLASKA